MTLDTFFEKFDLFADAPDAVGKMRELVLELAVQGKLVAPSSNPDKHPAWLAFRKEISERVYSYDPGPPPFEIPEHWEWCVIDDVAKSCGQKTPDEKFTYIDVGSIDNTCGKFKPELNIVEAAKAPSRARKLALPGSVIYATVRPYLKNIAVIDKDFSPPAIISTAFAILHPLSFIESRYLFYWLRSSSFEREVSAYAKGVAYPAISDSDLKGCFIPIPPLDEQKRIVAKVDELMALCDRLEAQQQEREQQHTALSRASLARFADAPTPANLQLLFHKSYTIPPADLRKSILTLAVQGLLVPHDTESASWKTRKLKELTTKIGSGSTPSGGKESYQDSGVPLIRSMNVHFGGFVRHGLAFLNAEQAEKLKNVTVKADDVLLNITGASIGRVATAPKDMEGARVNQHVCILRPTFEIIPPFLELFLASPVVQNLIDDIQVGATREALTKAMIEQFEIPVPSLAEQRRIVAKVEQLMALVDALETQLAASRATAKNLLDALVAELTSCSHKAS
jgi:type I restriction enzyme S subunit